LGAWGGKAAVTVSARLVLVAAFTAALAEPLATLDAPVPPVAAVFAAWRRTRSRTTRGWRRARSGARRGSRRALAARRRRHVRARGAPRAPHGRPLPPHAGRSALFYATAKGRVPEADALRAAGGV